MRKQSLYLLMFVLAAFFAPACTSPMKPSDKALPVIFETDMGNDIDDALALDMLYKYQDEGRVRLLGISSNKNNAYSVPFLDIMSTWYGYPGIPLGKVVNGVDSEGDSRNYAQAVCEYATAGEEVFKGSMNDHEQVPGSVNLYRKLLAAQPDSSVTIVSVGFSTNLAQLLESGADEYSRLTGRELVASKAKRLCVMAGSFDGGLKKGEYNVIKDIPSAMKVFAEWPGEIVVSPYEVGSKILYPASSIEKDFGWAKDHPMVVAYRSYQKMPYNRPTWDLTAVLYAVEGNEKKYFDVSHSGRVTVDGEGITHFAADPAGKHIYLSVDSAQAAAIKERFIELITKKPKKYENE